MQVILTTTTDSINGSKVLTVKEVARLKTVRKALQSDVNPYLSITTLAIGGNDKKDKPIVKKELTVEERRRKFNEPRLENGSHKWKFIDGDSDVIPDREKGPVCISCHHLLNTTTATYGRVVTQVIKKVIDFLKPLDDYRIEEARTVIGIPMYETGWCCKACFDILYSAIYYDGKGDMKRGIELLTVPYRKVKETYSTGKGREKVHTVPAESKTPSPVRDDNYPRGKDKIKRVSTISLGKGGKVLEADDEEWIIGGLPKQTNKELPNPAAYHRFTNTGRRKIG